MRLPAGLVGIAALLLAAGPADATKRLKKGPVAIDPALGYVLVRLGPTVGKKGKAPTFYIWRFDPATNELRFRKSSSLNPVLKGEDESAFFGDRPFAFDMTRATFLSSLTPGDYVMHGTESTCFCLGSYRFTVKPGEITDIGTVMIGAEDGTSPVPALAAHKLADDLIARGFLVPSIMAVTPATDDAPLPDEVRGLPVTRARLVADVRFWNRGPTRMLSRAGLLVNRAVDLPKPVSGEMADYLGALKAHGAKDVEIVAQPKLEPEPKAADPASPAKPAEGG